MSPSVKAAVLLLYAALLQMRLTLGQSQSPLPQSAEELALWVVKSSCDASNLTSFYLSIREREGMDRYFPVWSNHDEYLLPGIQLQWTGQEPYQYLRPSYDNFFSEYIQSRPNASSYKWCVYLVNTEVDLHGCVRGNEKWGTPIFEEFGLLDYLTTTDLGPEIGFGSLISLTIDNTNFYVGNTFWHNALISVNIDWHNPALQTMGQYYIIDAQRDVPQYIAGISAQSNFLIEGERKEFSCELFGTYRFYRAGWRRPNGGHILVQESPCEESERFPCESVEYSHHLRDTSSCAGRSNRRFFVGTDRMILTFRNSSQEDTGEYICFISDDSLTTDYQTRSLFIYVVFVEVFSNIILIPSERGQLQCSVKAPADAVVAVTLNTVVLNQPYDSLTFHENCDHIPKISRTSKPLDDQFSLFTVTIHICQVSIENTGTYTCQVHYSIPTDSKMQTALTTTTIIVPQNRSESDSGVLSREAAVGITCSIFIFALLLVTVLSIALWIVVSHISRKQLKRRKSKTRLHSLPSSFSNPNANQFRYRVATSENSKEFSRRDLEVHEQIGKGRFGKVLLASARNIIPGDPSPYEVAVKISLSSTLQCDEMMRGELEIMKRLEFNKHICNLLAYCTKDGPMCIIMEYAAQGNLKDYLDLCRQAVRQMGQSLYILNNYQNATEMNERKPDLISESKLRNCAFQIACGLEHLQSMNVVHCDLAARNILISKEFVLKIADFGMAKNVSDEVLQGSTADLDGIVAVKWAALEVLENKGYMLQSDIWSYAVTVWEIASYGGRPFSEQKIGASLDKFIHFLRVGHRLPQPSGLSNSIFQMLLSCWSANANVRPSCSSLRHFFCDYSN